MVNQTEKLDGIFYALSDPTRRLIMGRLAEGEATVKELASPFSMSLPAVSKHLKVLEKAGLLVRQVDGRVHRMRLQPDGLKTASEWVDHYRRFWDTQLDRLSAFLQVATERTERSARSSEDSAEDETE
jgi:DNA-binding transcriptional ArsR family regulator